MDIQGLDYNTTREPMRMAEYGREIQNMVDYTVGLPNRDDRLRHAKAIVRLMETKVPHLRGNSNYKQTLWDHLYIISNGKLDIDWPYNISQAESISEKPQPMKRPESSVRLRHYGNLVEQLFEQLKAMPEGPEREKLAMMTAAQMKRDLVQWGHGSVEDERVVSDLANYTDGKVQLDLKNRSLGKVMKAPAARKNRKKK